MMMAIVRDRWQWVVLDGRMEKENDTTASPLLIADSLSIALPPPPLSIACRLCQFGIHAIGFDDNMTRGQIQLKPSECTVYDCIKDYDDDDDDDESLRQGSVAIRHESRQLPH